MAKKKKRRPEDPPEQDETRGEGLEEAAAEQTSTETRKPSFFSFSGQLTPAELAPDTPSEEKPDVVEGDLESPSTPSQQKSTTAGPARDEPPAASTSASQTDEAAGPAAFLDDTHTELDPGHAPESDTSLRLPEAREGPAEAGEAKPWPHDTTATDPFALPDSVEPPAARQAPAPPAKPAPPAAPAPPQVFTPFGPAEDESEPFADDGPTRTEFGFETAEPTGTAPEDVPSRAQGPAPEAPPAPDAATSARAAPETRTGFGGTPSEAAGDTKTGLGGLESDAGVDTKTGLRGLEAEAADTKTGLGGVESGEAAETARGAGRTDDPSTRTSVGPVGDTDAAGTGLEASDPDDGATRTSFGDIEGEAESTRTSLGDIDDADSTRTSIGDVEDADSTRTNLGDVEDADSTRTGLGDAPSGDATRTRHGAAFQDAGATRTELGSLDLDLPAPPAPSGPETRTALPPRADDVHATHTEFRPFVPESETRVPRPPVDATEDAPDAAQAGADETMAGAEGEAPAAPALFTPEEEETGALAPFTEVPLFVPPELRVGDLDAQPDPSDAPVRRRRDRRAAPRKPSLLHRVRVAAGRVRARVAEMRARSAEARAERRTQAAQAKAESRLSQNAQWWRRTLTEIAVLYAIVIPVEMALNKGRIGAYGVHPHPYWLIVLPIAGARGVVAGLLSAGVASVLYTLGAWLARGGGDPTVLFTYRTMTEPILFFAVGYFVGELHDHLELKVQKLQRHLDEVQERNTRLRQERDVLGDANRELEKRIVDDSVQFGNLIVAATRIERAGRSEVFELSLELVEEHCGAASSVLMLLEDGSLDFLCTRGWPEDQTGTRLAAARSSAFVARAIGEGVAVNGFAPEETPPQEGPLVVAPLFDAGGVVRALLCLDDIPPTRLNESTITTFLGIAEWVSAALARLARGQDAPAPKAALEPVAGDADVHMGTAKDLGERLRLEVERCTRYGVPTSFLAIQAPEWKDASPEGVRTLDRYILTHFTTGMRPSDGMFRFGYPGCYLLVLAGTTVEGADVVRTRLLRRVEYSPQKHIGAVEIFATGPDASAPDLPSLIDRVAARFRRASPLPLEGRCPVEIPEGARPAGIDAFLRRLKMETSLAVRNGFDLYVLGISAEMADTSAPDLLVRHVHEAGARTLRPTDGVYSIGPRHCAVICPCTDGEQAATVAHRLATAVRKRDPDAPYGQLETKVVGLGSAHPDAGSLLEALAKRRPS